MKYIDFIVQSLILSLVLIVAVSGWIAEGKFAAGKFASLYGAVFLGSWQMFSSFLSILFKVGIYRMKRWHFFGALIYIITLVLCYLTGSGSIFLFFPPVLLALFYYSLTWRWVFQGRRRGRFLSRFSFKVM
jgi:hypothetical protein